MATISTADKRSGLTIVHRVARNIDQEAKQRMLAIEAARATAERIAALRQNIFRNAAYTRDLQAVETEPEAARLLISASDSADNFLVLGILRMAIDKRWNQVVQAGIRHFGEHPTSAAIQELWHLTTGRSAI
ncbi:hypothetical protein [Mycolicibacterium arseniciresistens]|uniref:Uncharacterized protein n=1 Tax=Mycolicibacterium arseniciresistens TaxID=3062257 RepID=A0ABT8UF48_9MYCO|nr:hypothetical protein [Mycolicibacterium arseniciresistens]MDO3636406.1 hypothetical protein [Mycolicibacterium arseniciresistens]